jgi:hypothetical protein
MITTQPSGRQTGRYTRVRNPLLPLTDGVLDARIARAKNPGAPMRNALAGASAPLGIFGRFFAWLRGEG